MTDHARTADQRSETRPAAATRAPSSAAPVPGLAQALQRPRDAATLLRTADGSVRSGVVAGLQRTHGNAAVARLVSSMSPRQLSRCSCGGKLKHSEEECAGCAKKSGR